VLRRVVSKCYGVEANKDAKRTKMLLESKMNANELKRHQVSGGRNLAGMQRVKAV